MGKIIACERFYRNDYEFPAGALMPPIPVEVLIHCETKAGGFSILCTYTSKDSCWLYFPKGVPELNKTYVQGIHLEAISQKINADAVKRIKLLMNAAKKPIAINTVLGILHAIEKELKNL